MKMKELCKGIEVLPNTEFVVATLCMIYAQLPFSMYYPASYYTG
jgi:hypothetical protein